MKRRSLLTVTAVTVGMLAGAASLPARADSGDIDFKKIWEMADKDKSGMVTKQEFLDAMGKAYDMKMEKMKAAKDTKMMKGDGMTQDGLKSLLSDVYKGA